MTSATWSGQKVKQTFIDFWKDRDHAWYPSGPVVPSDPSLFFVNATTNKYHSVFYETVDPNSFLGQNQRVVNLQKCIRAGGKHNDLEDVGKDTYHHTFFEMLGNSSFGDYGKEQCIVWTWELLTEVYKIPQDRLYVTYYEGDPKLNFEEDIISRDVWRRFLPESHVIPGNTRDNFWHGGYSGPCGPATEVHYDMIGGRDASALVNKDDPSVIEFWNITFIEFYQSEDGTYKPLSKKHVDTGIGVERLTAVVQGVTDNYRTDLFSGIMDKFKAVTGAKENYGDNERTDAAFRIIADHARMMTVAISDGVVPGRQFAKAVLRHIMRRALRTAYTIFDMEEKPFLSALVPVVVDSLAPFYPELSGLVENITAVVEQEENLFQETHEKGVKYLQGIVDTKKRETSEVSTNVIPGSKVFKAFHRYGIPFEYSKEYLAKRGYEADEEGFLEEQKEKLTQNHEHHSEHRDNRRSSKVMRDEKKLMYPAKPGTWLSFTGETEPCAPGFVLKT